jgi:hypothetical protein
MKVFSISIILALAFTCLGTANAAVPDLIPVQGVLTNNGDGTPVNGLTDMRFDIYDAITGGTLLWESVYKASTNRVDVDNGSFVVYLGELTAHPLDFSTLMGEDQLWLQLTVAGEAMGRLRLAAVAFSQEAEYCSQVGGLTEGDIQPALGAPCTTGNYLRGWNDTTGTPICEPDEVEPPTGTVDYYNVSGYDTVPENNVDQEIRLSNYGEAYRDANSSHTNIFAPIHLPNGVTVTTFRAWVIDNNGDPSANMDVRFYRRSVDTGKPSCHAPSTCSDGYNPVIAQMAGANTSTGDETENVRLLTDTTISNALIDNSTYDYYLYIITGLVTTNVSNLVFVKSQIEYTLP